MIFRSPASGPGARRIRGVGPPGVLADEAYSTLAALMREPPPGGARSPTPTGGPALGPGATARARGSSFAGAAGAAPRVDGGVVAALEASGRARSPRVEEVAAAASAPRWPSTSAAFRSPSSPSPRDPRRRRRPHGRDVARRAAPGVDASAKRFRFAGARRAAAPSPPRAAAASRERAAADDVPRHAVARPGRLRARRGGHREAPPPARRARPSPAPAAGPREPAVLAATAGAAQAALAREPAWAKFAGAASDFFRRTVATPLPRSCGLEPRLGARARRLPAKLREILEEPRHALVVAWRAETQSFRVLDKRAFCERVLPAYFKLKTPAADGDGPKKMFACFVRQLSYYGFHKMVRHVDEWRVVDDATITSPGDFSRLKRHLPASRAANRL
ncbi:DNA binding protein [Aureococcus anophagefferens]|nr:DNA binding protein [Aureococcus anophagefferens]